MLVFLVIFAIATIIFILAEIFPGTPIFSDTKKWWEEHHKHGAKVIKNSIEKYFDGFFVGIFFILIAWFDVTKEFIKGVNELMTKMNPAIVVFGFIFAFGYFGIKWFYSSEPGGYKAIVLRICTAWFDLVQQFFSLAIGAYFPIKILLVLRSTSLNDFSQHLNQYTGAFLLVLLGAAVFPPLWVLKDTVPEFENPKRAKKIYNWGFVFVAIFASLCIGGFFTDVKGGEVILEHLWSEIGK